MLYLLTILVGALIVPALAIVSIRYRAFPFLRNSYIFWSIVSAYNFNLLGWLAMPPILLLKSNYLSKFFPFLAAPVAWAVAAAITSLIGLKFFIPRIFSSSVGKEVLPVFFNLVLLLVFLFAAEVKSTSVITSTLAKHKPDCVRINSFISSMKNGGRANTHVEHALFTQGGKTFFWSYTELDFYEGQETLSRNFTCVQH